MILFLHGADTYRSRQKLKEIKEKFQKEVDPQGYNLLVFDGAQTNVGELSQGILASPFLASKRMVILERLSALNLSDKEEEALIDLFDRVQNEENILVIWEGEVKKRELSSALFKAVSKTKYLFPFEAWNHQQVAGWIAQKLQESGVTITPSALQYVSLSVENDLWLAASETEKLVHYAKANALSQLADQHVKQLLSAGAQDNVFALVDAVSARNPKESLSRLHDQIEAGSHELEILSLLFRQYRLIAQARSGLTRRFSAQEVAKAYDMHPFVAGKMLKLAERFSDEEVRRSYANLLHTDKQMKRSGLSMRTLLSTVVAQLSTNEKTSR